MTERVDTQDDGGRNTLNANGKVQISLFITQTNYKEVYNTNNRKDVQTNYIDFKHSSDEHFG